jgi:hypothetical protein
MNPDQIIEEWMAAIHHPYKTIEDLELSEGIDHVNNLRKLVKIAGEHKSQSKI